MSPVQRQLAMVMDLNKCIGCQTCSIACKQLWTRDDGMDYMWWNTVNTVPGRGTPRDWEHLGLRLPSRAELGDAWEFNHDETFYGGDADGRQLRIVGQQPHWGPNWDEDQGAGAHPNAYYFYLPRICNHCTHPACLEACPRNAIEKRAEDGIVLIDEGRCRGYRFCMEACPYKKIYYNHARAVSQKCIFCFPRVEQGVAPACARMCPGRVRFVGYRDDRDGPIWKLAEQWRVALPLHPEYGTQPNVLYVPPLAPPRLDENGEIDESRPRIPDAYLVSLFGPPVLEALERLSHERARARAGERSELMELLIGYRWTEMFGGFDRDPADLRRPPP